MQNLINEMAENAATIAKLTARNKQLGNELLDGGFNHDDRTTVDVDGVPVTIKHNPERQGSWTVQVGTYADTRDLLDTTARKALDKANLTIPKALREHNDSVARVLNGAIRRKANAAASVTASVPRGTFS